MSVWWVYYITVCCISLLPDYAVTGNQPPQSELFWRKASGKTLINISLVIIIKNYIMNSVLNSMSLN